MIEIWKDIKDFEGIYQISNLGRVKSLDRYDNINHFHKSHILKQRLDKDGYYIVMLYKSSSYKTMKVHRLVANAFIDNPNNFSCVNHKDEIRTNNSVENLEWCTVAYNNAYGTRGQKISKAQKGISKISSQGSNNYFYGKHFCGKDNHNARSIAQYDLHGRFIKKFSCIKEASDELCCSHSLIQSCCNGKRATAKGFLWEYIK